MLSLYQFQGIGEIRAPGTFKRFPTTFDLYLAEDADENLLDDAKQVIGITIVERILARMNGEEEDWN